MSFREEQSMKKFKLLTGMLLASIIASFSLGVGTLSAFAQQAELEGFGFISFYTKLAK